MHGPYWIRVYRARISLQGVLGKLGPWQIGPRAIFVANWAPADWAPANWAPADWAPADWAPANWAPANWAPVNWAPAFYIFVLDIFCQQLGDICHLEGVSAPIGSRVGEYAISRICTYILEYKMGTK